MNRPRPDRRPQADPCWKKPVVRFPGRRSPPAQSVAACAGGPRTIAVGVGVPSTECDGTRRRAAALVASAGLAALGAGRDRRPLVARAGPYLRRTGHAATNARDGGGVPQSAQAIQHVSIPGAVDLARCPVCPGFGDGTATTRFPLHGDRGISRLPALHIRPTGPWDRSSPRPPVSPGAVRRTFTLASSNGPVRCALASGLCHRCHGAKRRRRGPRPARPDPGGAPDPMGFTHTTGMRVPGENLQSPPPGRGGAPPAGQRGGQSPGGHMALIDGHHRVGPDRPPQEVAATDPVRSRSRFGIDHRMSMAWPSNLGRPAPQIRRIGRPKKKKGSKGTPHTPMVFVARFPRCAPRRARARGTACWTNPTTRP